MPEILSNPIVLVLLSVALGVLGTFLISALNRAAKSPQLKEIKSAYPVFDLILDIAVNTTQGTKYGFALEAAKSIWTGRGFTEAEAIKFGRAMIENFDLDKLAGLRLDKLSPAQVRQGVAIARSLMPDSDKEITAYIGSSQLISDGSLVGE